MQITLNLPDDIEQKLKTHPNPELFISDLVKAALETHTQTPTTSEPTWTAFFAQRDRLLTDIPNKPCRVGECRH